jgi:outer membrane protein assembly factor BamA
MWILVLVAMGYAGVADTLLPADTITYPSKRRARQPWEYAVSVPGWIIGAPFIFTTRAIAVTYRFLHRQETIREVLAFLFVVEDTTVVVMPAYSSHTGLGISYRKLGLITPGSQLRVTATYGTQNRHGVEIALRDLTPFGPPWRADLDVDYAYIPDRPFFGIGADNALDDETNFGLAGIVSRALLDIVPNRTVQAGTGIAFDTYFIFRGQDHDEPATQDVFMPDRLPGLDDGGLFLGPLTRLVFDFRGNRRRPTGGLWVGLEGALVWEITGEKLSHWKTGTDLRLYLEAPWFGDRVVVLRSLYQTVHDFAGGTPPFFLLPEFSGNETVRGYTTGRFRDRELLALSAEYRLLIWQNVEAKVDAVGFVDAGQVQEQIFDDAEWDDFHLGVGGGIRIYDADTYLGSVMVAFGKDEFRITADVGW